MAGVIGMGKVVEVDLESYTARVQDGELVTGWLRMGMTRAKGAQETWPYVIGEEVGFATIGGELEDGFIFCALANGQQSASATATNRKMNVVGDLEIAVGGNISMTAGANVTINGARIDLN